MDTNSKKCHCELEWRKDKAMLEQKIELMGLQVKEMKQREENYKKFNDTILGMYDTLQYGKQNSKIYQEIQQSIHQYSDELIKQKHKNTESLTVLENENRELKQKCQKLEQHITEITLKYEQQISQIDISINTQKNISNEENLKRKIDEMNQIICIKNQQLQNIEDKYEKKIQEIKKEQEQLYMEQIDYYKELFNREKEDLLEKKSLESIPFTEAFKKSVSEHHYINRIKASKASQMPLSTTIQKEYSQDQEKMVNDYQRKSLNQEMKLGCIISSKLKPMVTNFYILKNKRSKTNLNNKINKILEGETNQTIKLKEELSKTQFSNNSQNNCKNSPVMEGNPQLLLKSSDLKQMFGKECGKHNKAAMEQINSLVLQLQNKKLAIETQIADLENVNSQSLNLISEKKELQQKLKDITKELKKTKAIIQIKNQLFSDRYKNLRK